MPRIWTASDRQAASERAQRQRPWAHSTGPRTARGKSTSARNSYKHGQFTYEKRVLRWYVRLAALRLKQLHAATSAAIRERENELIEKYDLHHLKKPDIMAFYPHFMVSPLSPEFGKHPKTEVPYETHTVFDYLTALSDPNNENGLHNSD